MPLMSVPVSQFLTRCWHALAYRNCQREQVLPKHAVVMDDYARISMAVLAQLFKQA
ncbi:hypothetical protein EMGBS1_01770 [Chloroflexota bacterium]|nr:hypothetical protein EMGBS1_01770 [Chloroflexota bacterium]